MQISTPCHPFLLLVFLPLFTKSQDLDKTITFDNRVRQYMIHLPPAFNHGTRLPVIFAFHGGGGEYKKTIRYYNLNGLADRYGYIIVYPNAVNKAWSMQGVSSRVRKTENTVDDVGFISALLDNLIAEFSVDSSLVFCTGISRGGIFSLFLAWQLSERIKAIAPVCASIPQSIARDYVFMHPTPVLLINGTEDPLINYKGGPGKMNTRNAGNQEADMLPTENLIEKMVKMNNCPSDPIISNLPDLDPGDGCTAVDFRYPCKNGLVEFIKVIHGGHAWPGGIQYLPKFIIGKVCRDFRAEDKIVEFFQSLK
jgi:polyhydroxybutyrate depolymerase